MDIIVDETVPLRKYTRQTCTGCQKNLDISVDYTSQTVTCPECHAEQSLDRGGAEIHYHWKPKWFCIGSTCPKCQQHRTSKYVEKRNLGFCDVKTYITRTCPGCGYQAEEVRQNF